MNTPLTPIIQLSVLSMMLLITACADSPIAYPQQEIAYPSAELAYPAQQVATPQETSIPAEIDEEDFYIPPR